jgi:hypothetical protein
MPDVRLRRISLVENAATRQNGDLVIAVFACETSGILIDGCQLLRLPNSEMSIAPPRPGRGHVLLLDRELEGAILVKAGAAYRALTGKPAAEVRDA